GTTTTTSSAGRATAPWTWTARLATRRVSRRPTRPGSRSTKPRWSTGVDAPSAWRTRRIEQPHQRRGQRRDERLRRARQERDHEHQRERESGHPVPSAEGAPAENQPRLVAEPAGPLGAPPAFALLESDGGRLRLRGGAEDAGRRGAEAGPHRADDDVAGLVACGLRPLRTALHPDELARRGHVPHPRRPRRRGRRLAALRSPQQLA